MTYKKFQTDSSLKYLKYYKNSVIVFFLTFKDFYRFFSGNHIFIVLCQLFN